MFHRANNTIRDMQSKEQSRGHKLTTSNMILIVAGYALTFGAYTSFMTWNLIPGAIMTVIMGFIGLRRIVPQEINARYFQYGLLERHAFMSGMTQIFGSGNNKTTVVKGLQESLIDLYGEFKQDIESLISVIEENGHGERTHDAFVRLRDKYNGDIWFIDFLEQLETTNESGIINTDAFHNIMLNADRLADNQDKYQQEKLLHKRTFYIIQVCILFALYFIISGFGIDNYVRIFAHTGIGWLIAGIYLLYMFITFHSMYKHFYDESITSVK